MPVIISDDVLEQARLTEQEARVEIACRLFQAGKLELWPAAQLAGLSRVRMEDELGRRRIPIYRPSVEEVEKELAALDRLGV